VLDAAGHDRLADLEGTARRLPVTFLTIGAASVTLMGLPPSGAFVAKWILLGAALENGQGWLAAVIVGGGLLAAAYLFPVLAIPLRGSSMDPPLSVPRSMEWTALALALGALLLGLVATPFLHLVGIGTPSIAGAMEAGP
jgi:multicomponent Na+:H+ antiporter subunit D